MQCGAQTNHIPLTLGRTEQVRISLLGRLEDSSLTMSRVLGSHRTGTVSQQTIAIDSLLVCMHRSVHVMEWGNNVGLLSSAQPLAQGLPIGCTTGLTRCQSRKRPQGACCILWYSGSTAQLASRSPIPTHQCAVSDGLSWTR